MARVVTGRPVANSLDVVTNRRAEWLRPGSTDHLEMVRRVNRMLCPSPASTLPVEILPRVDVGKVWDLAYRAIHPEGVDLVIGADRTVFRLVWVRLVWVSLVRTAGRTLVGLVVWAVQGWECLA